MRAEPIDTEKSLANEMFFVEHSYENQHQTKLWLNWIISNLQEIRFSCGEKKNYFKAVDISIILFISA